MSGVLFLVPGGLGVKSSLKILDQDISSGSKFSFQVIVIALSISLGLLGSRIIPPVETHLSKKKVEKNIVIGAEKENIGNGKDGSESRKGSGEGDREEIADKKGRKVTISIPMLPLNRGTLALSLNSVSTFLLTFVFLLYTPPLFPLSPTLFERFHLIFTFPPIFLIQITILQFFMSSETPGLLNSKQIGVILFRILCRRRGIRFRRCVFLMMRHDV